MEVAVPQQAIGEARMNIEAIIRVARKGAFPHTGDHTSNISLTRIMCIMHAHAIARLKTPLPITQEQAPSSASQFRSLDR